MVHREGDATSTIDGALGEGPRIVGALASEIAQVRKLRDDWLSGIENEPEPDVSMELPMTIRKKVITAAMQGLVNVSGRCVAVAMKFRAGALRKRYAPMVIQSVRVSERLVDEVTAVTERGRDGGSGEIISAS